MIEIFLDGTLHSKLDWSKQRILAKSADQILWNIELGLFANLPQPLSSVSQYHSLKLSLDHFCNILWKEFSDKTLGICLYKGSVDFSKDFPWDSEQENHLQEWLKRGFGDVSIFYDEIGIEIKCFQEVNHKMLRDSHLLQLFCRDVAGEYIDLLSGYLPDGLEAFISFDTHTIQDPLELALLTTKERFPHVKLITDGQQEQCETVGVCLPSMDLIRPSTYRNLSGIFRKLKEENITYRVIPEAILTSEWHGLDVLYVSPETLTPLGHRKLQGFIAAGGRVV
jgi:hypothetical protein